MTLGLHLLCSSWCADLICCPLSTLWSVCLRHFQKWLTSILIPLKPLTTTMFHLICPAVRCYWWCLVVLITNFDFNNDTFYSVFIHVGIWCLYFVYTFSEHFPIYMSKNILYSRVHSKYCCNYHLQLIWPTFPFLYSWTTVTAWQPFRALWEPNSGSLISGFNQRQSELCLCIAVTGLLSTGKQLISRSVKWKPFYSLGEWEQIIFMIHS